METTKAKKTNCFKNQHPLKKGGVLQKGTTLFAMISCVCALDWVRVSHGQGQGECFRVHLKRNLKKGEVRFFFSPPCMRNQSPDSRRLSIRFDRFSVIFNQFQIAVSII